MISFIKVPPTKYVLQFQAGKIRREGAGLSFLYWAPTSTIVAIPVASTDLPFAFQEATADFQTVTLQGQLTYRVSEPKRLASLPDYSVDGRLQFLSDDPKKLPERLVHVLETLTRSIIQRLALKNVLVSSDAISSEALQKLSQSEAVGGLGVEILSLAILAIKPTPETSRALEAEAREALQRRADEAIYARRNAAVEQERMIKESELRTEIAVEEKKRQIRETQMAAEIAVEERRSKAAPGDIVVAQIDQVFSVKYLAEDESGFYLKAANQADDNFRDKEYRPTKSLTVIGVVTGSFRSYTLKHLH